MDLALDVVQNGRVYIQHEKIYNMDVRRETTRISLGIS